ncbi:MAG: hybrid sensor histidine kinase/response regulator [Myxococcota bacterium]
MSESLRPKALRSGGAPSTAASEIEPGQGGDAAVRERHALEERTKELRCLYAVSRELFRAGDDDAAAFRRVVEAIPAGWQFPEVTVARLVLDEVIYTTQGFREGVAKMCEPIHVEGRERGRIEVHYLAPRPEADEGPFLHEERTLLHAVAERVGETMARRRAEQRLARREAHFRALVESAADLIVVVDLEGIVRYASPAAPSLLGMAPAHLVGRSVFDVVHPEDESILLRLFEEARSKADMGIRAEVRVRRGDGSYVHVDAVGRRVHGDFGIDGLLVVARDITARKHLEEELRQAQKMEAVGRLAGGIAHDFNNLLTVIDVQSELLFAELTHGDPRREDVEEIRRASRQGAALTRQLLAVGRRQVTKARRTDVNRLIADLQRMLERVLGEDVELSTKLAAEPATVYIDPGQLEQVLLNLALNARDAMEGGGRLRIATRRVASAGPGGGAASGRQIEIAVHDTGSGMAPEVAEHVFEPFFTTKRGGTGLGLSTVYGIVHQNGGDVRVESAPGAGTTFIVRLPAVEGAAERTSRPPPPPSDGGSETILLVEDDDRLRRATRRVLRRMGYEVLEASSGPDALRVARSHGGPIHLLLTDVVMPEMGGPELAEALVAERRNVRVLFSSGYSGDVVARQAPGGQDVSFLDKPFTPAALGRAVREALDGARPSGTTG